MAEPTPLAVREFNFDGIVGPTHNYSGLSYGNVASTSHKHQASNPRAAALQGLEKMRQVSALGVAQAVLPPLRRPDIAFLNSLGFEGSAREVIARAAASDSRWLAAAYSASNMWTANAATVSPSADCADGRVHLSIANLTSTLHRSLEAAATSRVFEYICRDPAHFCVHPPLPAAAAFSDEGAANHTRLAGNHGQPGIECFAYGRSSDQLESALPRRFPARQSREASECIARRHQLAAPRTVFALQNPVAIDAGVFHNDVIAVGNEYLLLCHEMAFVDQNVTLEKLRRQFAAHCGRPLLVIQISSAELSLDEAVKSYLFNSQLVTRPDGKMSLLCPAECESMPAAARCLQAILAGENPIDQLVYINLRQSMHNGGGPACLRLRMVLTPAEQNALHQGILFTESLDERLVGWVNRHYRDRLSPDDLADPQLFDEVATALDDLTQILGLPADLL